jgi:hypothetical protein
MKSKRKEISVEDCYKINKEQERIDAFLFFF